MKIVSIVGMAGSGKSEVAKVFEESGFARIRFGDLTDVEMAKRGLVPGAESERAVRESLRKEHGMSAYARLNLARIDDALKRSDVVIDGLYSWEEYTFLKDYYKDNLFVISVWSSPATRYSRLANRAIRPLSSEEAAERDKAEIENVNKGGPIAMADVTIINESPVEILRNEAGKVVARLK